MGVAQHHDAVSGTFYQLKQRRACINTSGAGTEKQHVAYDYAKRIAAGRAVASVSVAASLATLTGAILFLLTTRYTNS